jgi:hypothetical protein
MATMATTTTTTAMTTATATQGLWYANGVAHGTSPEGHRFVLVVETDGFRVYKKWLTGPRARAAGAGGGRGGGGLSIVVSDVSSDESIAADASVEVLVEGLPGFPDGITEALDGTNFWLSLVAPLNPLMLRMLTWPLALRTAFTRVYFGLEIGAWAAWGLRESVSE